MKIVKLNKGRATHLEHSEGQVTCGSTSHGNKRVKVPTYLPATLEHITCKKCQKIFLELQPSAEPAVALPKEEPIMIGRKFIARAEGKKLTTAQKRKYGII